MLKKITTKNLNFQIDSNSIQLRGVQHDSLLTTFDCFYEQGDYWLVMPYFNSISLETLIRVYFPSGITDKVLLRYILSVLLSVLKQVHSSLSAIKSLKPSKILIDQNGILKVLDCEVSSTVREMMLRRKTVSPYWNAPEVINGATSDCRSDVWTLGVLVIWLLTGKNPWEDYPFLKASMMITDKPPYRMSRDTNCEGFLKDLAGYCIQKEPEKRPTGLMLVENQYFNKFSGAKHASAIMNKILSFNDGNIRKLETMLQPMPLSGEDPNEMLDPEFDTE